MNEFLFERIEYGRRIQDAANVYLSNFGSAAGQAAWDSCQVHGLPDEEKAFRLAVSARVARLLGPGDAERAA